MFRRPKTHLLADPCAYTGVDWYRVAEGCVLSAGEVYGVDTFAGSVVILVGLAVYSPLLSVASFIGGVIGTMSAVYLAPLSRSALVADCLVGSKIKKEVVVVNHFV